MPSIFPILGWLLAGLCGGVLLLAAAWDATTLTIPNRLVLLLAAGGLAAQGLGTAGPSAALLALLTAAGILTAGAALFFAGLWGAGDAKLLAAVALWVGPAGIGGVLLRTALIGGVLALVVLAWHRWRQPSGEPGAEARVPYGVAIAFGALPHCLVMVGGLG
jgi:prepilin peptidase CpaA